MGHALTREHLARACLRAQPRSQVEGTTPVATVDRHRLARVQSDADAQGQRRVELDLVREHELEVDRSTERLAGRGEDGQRLVAAQLDDLAIVRLDALPRD